MNVFKKKQKTKPNVWPSQQHSSTLVLQSELLTVQQCVAALSSGGELLHLFSLQLKVWNISRTNNVLNFITIIEMMAEPSHFQKKVNSEEVSGMTELTVKRLRSFWCLQLEICPASMSYMNDYDFYNHFYKHVKTNRRTATHHITTTTNPSCHSFVQSWLHCSISICFMVDSSDNWLSVMTEHWATLTHQELPSVSITETFLEDQLCICMNLSLLPFCRDDLENLEILDLIS